MEFLFLKSGECKFYSSKGLQSGHFQVEGVVWCSILTLPMWLFQRFHYPTLNNLHLYIGSYTHLEVYISSLKVMVTVLSCSE